MEFKKKIGIIGIGKMGEALISGLIKSKFVKTTNIVASDVLAKRRKHISEHYDINCYSDNKSLIKNSDVVIIAVSPRNMKEVLEDIRELLAPSHLIISIAAGISTSFILKHIHKQIPLIRAMPNNPCMIGEGMIALTTTPIVSDEDLKDAKELFSSIGKVIILQEHLFNAVTGLSGSGPAYTYLFIEALADGGVKVGIPKDIAIVLAAQTVLGSAKMVLKSGNHPAILKDKVATPQGTTVCGLLELEEGKVRASIIRAVENATIRAHELEIGRNK